MKYITTIALALGFSASMALAEDKPLVGQLACSKCTAKKTAKCGPAFLYKDKKGKTQVLLIKGKAAKAVAHKEICKPGTKLEVSIVGKIDKGTIVASKLTKKQKK